MIEIEYVADGIAESLIGRLSRISRIRVMARSATFRYKGRQADPQTAGRRLNADYVVVGTVTFRAEELSVHAELVDVAGGWQLWSHTYRAVTATAGEIDEALAAAIVGQLGLSLSDAESFRLKKRETLNADARRHYLKARHFLNQMSETGIHRAVEHFERAIGMDERFALAYAGLADAYTLLAFLSHQPANQVMPRAKAAAIAALTLDDGLAEAHASLASIAKIHDWDWAKAEDAYRRALELNPNFIAAYRWYAAHLAAQGRSEESQVAMRRAAELDPVSPIITTERAWHAYMARDFETARIQSIDALDTQPGFPAAHFSLGLANEQLGRHQEAIDAFRAAAAASPNPAIVASEAHTFAVMAHRLEALAAVRRLEELATERYVAPYWLAIISAGLNDVADAFMWLERAVDQHDVWLVWAKTDPRFDPLRSDSRFVQLLATIGFD